MPEPTALSSTRARLGFGVFFLTALVGLFQGLNGWISVPAASIALLWITDRGQHRLLVERAPNLPDWAVLSLSIAAHLLNNVAFTSLAYFLGVGIAWLLHA